MKRFGALLVGLLLALLVMPIGVTTELVQGQEVIVAYAALDLHGELAALTIQAPAIVMTHTIESFTSNEAIRPEVEMRIGDHPVPSQGYTVLKEPHLRRT